MSEQSVIPAQAGIQRLDNLPKALDDRHSLLKVSSGFRGNDERQLVHTVP
jgi:hypothetical protein